MINEKLLAELKGIHRVQGENGNWDFNEYNWGIFNGMECLMSIIEKRDPCYRDKPKSWKEGK